MTVKEQHFGAAGNDVIAGTKAERIFDIVWSGAGDDTIRLYAGPARVHAGRGDDTIVAGSGARIEVFCGPGDDRVDLSRAGASIAWPGRDPTTEDRPVDAAGDVDVIRFGSARGQLAYLTANAPGTKVIAGGVWSEKHHIMIDDRFAAELVELDFVRWSDGFRVKRAVLELAGEVELVIRFARPDPGDPFSNEVFDHRPSNWEDMKYFDPTYGFVPGDAGAQNESFWFGLLV